MNYKKFIFILCCGLVAGIMNAQQITTFSYTGAIVNYTVPANCVTSLTITAVGGGGGGGTHTPGLGTSMQGVFNVTPGEVLKILVGQKGASGTYCSGEDGGGGGGSFVTDNNNNPLIVAGGGGGASGNSNGVNASIRTCGTTGLGNGAAGGCAGAGGGSGYGASGGGLTGNGANAGWGSSIGGGQAFVNGGAGGTSPYGATGGFGGGAGAHGDCCVNGGGGGGYSGGGAAGTSGCYGAGGGGSYNAGTNQVNDSAFNSGNGTVIIASGLGATVVVAQNVPCFGENVGIIAGVVGGTTPPYTYSWAPAGQTTDTISDLAAGTYTLTAMDGCGHTATAVATVTQPAMLNILMHAANNVTCNGGSNGVATAIVSGGTGPYTYSWSPVISSNATVAGLSAGTYSLDVVDAHGCVSVANITITQPGPVSVAVSATNVSCNGGNNGNATASGNGGSAPYKYSWSNGQTNYLATGLIAGTYTLTMTDKNGCSATAISTITQPATVSVTANINAGIKCYGGSAGISATISGGSLPYTYAWSNGGTSAFNAGLMPGTYSVTVWDYCGGSATASVTVTQPAAPLIDSNAVVGNVTCNGVNDGCSSAFANGGTGPYSYMWSDANRQATPTACGLSAGTYTVNITDANGCTTSAATTITQPAAISVVTNTTSVLAQCTGSAWVKVSGGTAPYTYSWSNGNVTDSISGLCKGPYCCTIKDAEGCEKNVCVTVNSSTGIANLNGGTDGITVYPNPNSGQFTIQAPVASGQSTVEIYNVLGEKVYSQLSTFNAPLSINLSSQPNGIYLYRVINENGSLLGEGKVVLQK